MDEAVWHTIASILVDPDQLLVAAREESRERGLVESQARLRSRLEKVDRNLAKARNSLATLIRFHAEKNTLDDITFEAAAGPLKEEVVRLDREGEELLAKIPGARWDADKQAISQVASEIVDRLEDLDFEERQKLLALLDVDVSLSKDGYLEASLTAPSTRSETQRKVLKRTSSRWCLRTCR